ncbi:MAG: carbon-nitrogen hydrolase family protein [candidate division WOR-3 bacterium]
MKVALAVNYVTSDFTINCSNILNQIEECSNDTDLILFPEAAITGLINNDDPAHDFLLGIEIPGEFTDILSSLAKKRKKYIGIGVLEKADYRLYDTAILISPFGDIVLKYRRITPGWHGKKTDPSIYREGDDIPVVETVFGKLAFLICGDLFDDEILKKVRNLKLDYLLFPFARSFEGNVYSRSLWDKEKKKYIARVELLKTTTLMVNYLASPEIEDGSFGGAMVVSPNGAIIAEMPIGKSGVLKVAI